MSTQILSHVPAWVFIVFFLLMAMGLRQMRPHRLPLQRVLMLAFAWAGVSLYSVTRIAVPQPLLVLAAWALTIASTTVLVALLPLPAGVGYDPDTDRFSLPGSAFPLLMIMGIFFTKFAAGVVLAQSPELAHQVAFEVPVNALYGCFSGLFLGRALRLWRVAAGHQVRLAPAA